MLKNIIFLILSAAVIFCTTAAVTARGTENTAVNDIEFDFEDGDNGFVPIFADYPSEDNADKFYEFDYDWRKIPIDNVENGLFISGNNHSDDLFMGYYKELNGFAPNKSYDVDVSLKLATNVDGGQMGIGGSPGASVYVKCGMATQKPNATADDYGYYRLNIDKGNQASDGKDMKTVGTVEKQETTVPKEYELNEYNFSIEMTADENGNAYFIVGTDSGFEGTTSYYISDVEIQLKETSPCYEKFAEDINAAVTAGIIDNKNYIWKDDITRAEFCELAYNMINSVKELPVAKLSRNPFDDINNPKINALAFVGIVDGKEDYLFVPNDKITREEAAVILYRIAEYGGVELPLVNVDMSYSDNNTILGWAISSVYSLKALNIMTDKVDDLFEPKTNYTFEKTVYSLMRIYNIIKNVG